ncbi:MAG: NADH:ubiquinone oxidoreductase subunit [Nitrospira sp.]|nr:NADH:ubiquinone oxidoreductase subunit [Nitrospira sp.]
MDGHLWPLALYSFAVLAIVAGMIGISALLGERHRERSTDDPYESGIPVTGQAHLRVPVQFYLMAILFVIFDMEAAFIFAWAVALPEVGWLGFGEMLVFIAVLFIALIYLWRVGALEWGTPSPSVHTARKERQDALVAH